MKLSFLNALNHKKEGQNQIYYIDVSFNDEMDSFTEAETISTFEKGTGFEGLGGTLILREATKNETLSNN